MRRGMVRVSRRTWHLPLIQKTIRWYGSLPIPFKCG